MSSIEAIFGPQHGRTQEITAEQRVKQLLALNKAAIAITGELELDSLLQRIVDVARELVGCKYAALGVLGDDGYIARFPTSGVSETEREQIGAPPRGHGLLGIMLRAGSSLRVADMSKDLRRVGFPPNHPGMTSLLGVPIFMRDKLVGDLYLTEKIGGSEFLEEDEWIVQLLATHAATALTNAQLHEANVRALHNLRTLQDAVQRIASHLELEPLTDELLRYACELTGSDLAWLGMLDANSRYIVPFSVAGGLSIEEFKRRVVDMHDPAISDDPSARALTTLKPQVVADMADNPMPPLWHEVTVQHNLRSSVSIPLIYHEKAVGVFTLFSNRASAFEEADLALLGVMAGHAAVALQNAIHYRQVSREKAGSQALLSVNQAINRLVHLDEVIPMIVESAVKLLDAAGAAVYLLGATSERGDTNETELVIARYSKGLDEAPSRVVRLPLDRSIAGRAIKTGKTLVVNDVGVEPDLVYPRLVEGPLRSLVAVPLWVGDEEIGVISAYSARTDAFDNEAVQLLEAFGAQASTAIYNARLYEEAQRGREAAELEQQRLKELEQMKDEFLSTAAHELRTPLTTIRMSAGLAHEQMNLLANAQTLGEVGALDSRLLDLVSLIIEGSERMHSLVNDLLDLTRLEQGRTTLVMEELDLREVVTASVESVRPLFESKGQPITLHLSENYCGIRGDRQRLEQVVINLLSNAHKYSPPNTPVEVRTTRSGGECYVSVRDNGPGVPEDERERIFERFYRSSIHRQDRTASTGLGLPIARKVAEMHHGRVWVERGSGKGSIFTLALPGVR